MTTDPAAVPSDPPKNPNLRAAAGDPPSPDASTLADALACVSIVMGEHPDYGDVRAEFHNWVADCFGADVCDAMEYPVAGRPMNVPLPWEQGGNLFRKINAQTILTEPAPHTATGLTSKTVEAAQCIPLDQVKHFEGCTWIESLNQVFYRGTLYDHGRFDVAFGGSTFFLTHAGETKEDRTASAWKTFTQSRALAFPKVKGEVFRPEMQAGAVFMDAGEPVINSYWPVITACLPGDPAPFRNHLAKLLPDPHDREILICYLVACLQSAGRKFQWAPVIQGMEGNGKTIILDTMERCIGFQYTHRPNADDLKNKFTGWLHRKLLCGIEELRIGSRLDLLETLKPMITNARIEIQAKGADQVTGDNRANFLMMSNHKDAVILRDSSRRYAIFYTAQQEHGDLERDGMDRAYFAALRGWLFGLDDNGREVPGKVPGYAIVNHWLRSYAIPDELNPAGQCNRAPKTSSTTEALAVSQGPVEQAILEAIEADQEGFRGGFVSTIAVSALLEVQRAKLSDRQRGEIMAGLGWVLHPGLKNGRVDNPILPDNGKTRLYVRQGSDVAKIEGGANIAKAYTAAQLAPTLPVVEQSPTFPVAQGNLEDAFAELAARHGSR